MSHLAINAHNEIVLATEVKDDFLRDGTLEAPYRCVFCDVAVEPRAYSRDDYATEAHFKISKSPHQPGCPYGSAGSWSGSTRSATRTLFGEELFLPNELIAKRTVSLGAVGGPGGSAGGFIDVATRTGTYQHLLGSGSHAATSVLARVVEAWIAARRICYKQAAKKQHPSPHVFVGEKLTKYELKLFGAHSNYSTAFHKFVSSWSSSAVHYGLAKVDKTPGGFELVPIDIDKKTKAPFARRVSVDANVFVPNQMTTQLVSQLDEAVSGQRVIHWFGYGSLPDSVEVHLQISDSSLLYLRNM